MAIVGVSEDRVRDVLKRHLTPSLHITSPDRLFGRSKRLTQIGRAFNSVGRHIFIHGDRGVGKTSLALTAAYIEQNSAEEPIYVLCGTESTFADIILAIGNHSIPLKERMESGGIPTALEGTFAGFGGKFQKGVSAKADLQKPDEINAALDIIRYAISRRETPPVIVIDELERLGSEAEKLKLAEFVNSLSSALPSVKLVLCGIGQTVEDLLGAHQSAVRKLENVELDRLRHDELWKIISSVADELDVEVDTETLIRIGQISDGFPHYVHLIGESLFWSMFDDDQVISKCSERHYRAGIKGALERTEAEHKSAYQKATQKTKNTKDYEYALWALADHSNLRRQLTAIYDDSYLDISRQLKLSSNEVLDKAKLNDRLLKLRSEGHGQVLIGHGAGWFSFRENILRGYVRLVAENNGVKLARDNYIRT